MIFDAPTECIRLRRKRKQRRPSKRSAVKCLPTRPEFPTLPLSLSTLSRPLFSDLLVGLFPIGTLARKGERMANTRGALDVFGWLAASRCEAAFVAFWIDLFTKFQLNLGLKSISDAAAD